MRDLQAFEFAVKGGRNMVTSRTKMWSAGILLLAAVLACSTVTEGVLEGGSGPAVETEAATGTGVPDSASDGEPDAATEMPSATKSAEEEGSEPAGAQGFDLAMTDWDALLVDVDSEENKVLVSPEEPVENFQQARWSPGGDWIALGAQMNQEVDGAQFGLYVVRPDGSELTRLGGELLLQLEDFRWSPEGGRLAVSGSDESLNWEVYVADPNSGEVEVLTSGANADDLAWSPAGDRLAVGSLSRVEQILVLDVEEPDSFEQITEQPGRATAPDWSPEGGRLVYEHAPEELGAARDIHIIGIDGRGMVPLTENELDEAEPRWSPTGDRIAFARQREDSPFVWDLVLVDPDGSNEVVLTAELLAEGQVPQGTTAPVPAWSPDGGRIAIVGEDGNLHLLAADGSTSQTVPMELGLFGAGISWRPAAP